MEHKCTSLNIGKNPSTGDELHHQNCKTPPTSFTFHASIDATHLYHRYNINVRLLYLHKFVGIFLHKSELLPIGKK